MLALLESLRMRRLPFSGLFVLWPTSCPILLYWMEVQVVMPLVLVIDDNEDERIIARTLLGIAGYRVVDAGDAMKGVGLAERRRPDLIVLDLMMPGANGLDALRGLRERPTTRAIPVLLYTAYADVFADEIDRAGPVQVLRKPMQGRDFLEAVRWMLAEGRRRDTAAA